ncbi:MAG: hypothetical protein ACI8RZ_002485 [Myxococcota bacterium]|jgi:hypothetical protein
MNDPYADAALKALQEGDPDKARKALQRALKEAPHRLDLRHALAVTLLRQGEIPGAIEQLDEALATAREQADETAATMMPQLLLARAAACEDCYRPKEAEAAYREVLTHEEDNPRALQGLSHLLMAWGRLGEGQVLLRQYIAVGGDGPEFADAAQSFLAAVDRFVDEDLHPRNFLEAHRGSYVEFFDHHAERMEAQGWIAEAARMQRLDDGTVAPVIPEGARPYAAVRIDLVDPSTGQPGQVGDQPMVVALAGYEPLSQAMVLVDWPERPFPVWVSSICPWDQLPIQVTFGYDSDPVKALDPIIGDWYTAGYNGEYGETERGRFHYISDPERIGPRSVLYHVDCGRAELRSIDELLKRLEILHSPYRIEAVLLGRGFLPEPVEALPPEVAG